MKKYLVLTLVISILLGIILPLVLRRRDLTLIVICLSSVWFIFAVILLILTFLVKLGLKTKAGGNNGVMVVRYELLNAGKKK